MNFLAKQIGLGLEIKKKLFRFLYFAVANDANAWNVCPSVEDLLIRVAQKLVVKEGL